MCATEGQWKLQGICWEHSLVGLIPDLSKAEISNALESTKFDGRNELLDR